MHHLNIGILAHVDAGKTSLTEQLLCVAGVIDRPGRVDAGDTVTDSLDIERRRGITIRSAVVSFPVDDVRVNLIDTPGHPDFIAEVQRALRVLDGVVLVVSAVEGVQAQTRVLARVLRKLRLPVLVFVNKIDRPGSRDHALLADLGLPCVPLATVEHLGTPSARSLPAPVVPSPALAEILAEHSDDFLARYLRDAPIDYRAELRVQTRRAQVWPVFFGSARTGDGIIQVFRGIREFLAVESTPDGPLRAEVFKIERGRIGEKIAYARVFSGSLAARDQVDIHPLGTTGKLTSVQVFTHGAHTVEGRARAGQIAKVVGLKEVRIGDRLGLPDPDPAAAQFPPPTLETVARPANPAEVTGLYAALRELSEQDPLISVRHDEGTRQLSVRLYGEVQREVLQETLADRGFDVEFVGTRTICVQRPAGTGSSLWLMGEPRNPHLATLGLRVEPGAGISFTLDVELGALPLSFHKAIEDAVRAALARGPAGWEIVDCAVTVTHTAYYSPATTAGDFRRLAPLALAEALARAGTDTLEPLSRIDLEVPQDCLAGTVSRLIESAGAVTDSSITGTRAHLLGTLPTARVHRFEQQLPGLSHGEGVIMTEFAGYQRIGCA